jgi:hypothetical protein
LKETAVAVLLTSSATRRRDRAAVVAVAVLQIFETAPAPELRAALEAYLADEFCDVQQQVLADYAQYWGSSDA